MKAREIMIYNYLEGYNNFDVDKMVKDFDKNVVFENISNGESSLVIHGIAAFKEQAAQATSYFSVRKQTAKSFKHLPEQTEVEIDYYAVLATDLPNGMKNGDEVNFAGKSIFRFSGDRITELRDIS